MSSTFTMYGRQLMVALLLTPDAITPLTTMQVALTLTIPLANASQDQLVEPTAASYARQSYTLGSANWGATGFAELFNLGQIAFPRVDEPWGVIRGWALVDPVAGQCLAVGSIDDPYEAVVGFVAQVDPGQLVLGIYD